MGNLLFRLHKMLVTQNEGDENNLKVIYKIKFLTLKVKHAQNTDYEATTVNYL